jgi:hypothetical protein
MANNGETSLRFPSLYYCADCAVDGINQENILCGWEVVKSGSGFCQMFGCVISGFEKFILR